MRRVPKRSAVKIVVALTLLAAVPVTHGPALASDYGSIEAIATADLDGDGRREVLLHEDFGTRYLTARTATGRLLWYRPSAGNVVVENFFGTGSPEIVDYGVVATSPETDGSARIHQVVSMVDPRWGTTVWTAEIVGSLTGTGLQWRAPCSIGDRNIPCLGLTGAFAVERISRLVVGVRPIPDVDGDGSPDVFVDVLTKAGGLVATTTLADRSLPVTEQSIGSRAGSSEVEATTYAASSGAIMGRTSASGSVVRHYPIADADGDRLGDVITMRAIPASAGYSGYGWAVTPAQLTVSASSARGGFLWSRELPGTWEQSTVVQAPGAPVAVIAATTSATNGYVTALYARSGYALWNTPTATAGAPATSYRIESAGDFDADGYEDIHVFRVAPSAVQAMLIRGKYGDFQWYRYDAHTPLNADVTGDNVSDVAMMGGSDTMTVKDGRTSFSWWSGDSAQIVRGDLNAAGAKNDFVRARFLGDTWRIEAVEGSTGTVSWISTRPAVYGETLSFLAGDLTGDGGAEVIEVAKQGNSVRTRIFNWSGVLWSG